MDAWIIQHLNGNWMTLSLVVYVLQAVAIIHPGVVDNQVSTLVKIIYNSLRSGIAPKDFK